MHDPTMPSGLFKGRRMSLLPTRYLSQVADSAVLPVGVRAAIRTELARRAGQPSPEPPRGQSGRTTTRRSAMSNAMQSPAADNAVARRGPNLEQVLIKGDLSQASEEQRLAYYKAVCDSCGLNPLTKPFEYLFLKGRGGEPDKLILYATKNCAEQLRRNNRVSITVKNREQLHGVLMVTVEAVTADGRRDEAIGCVPIEKEAGTWKKTRDGKSYFEGTGKFEQLRGEALANAWMKCETKAKRRATLSICGLGMPDETELDELLGRRADSRADPALPPGTAVQQPSLRALPEPDPTLITMEEWGQLKSTLAAGGATQKELLDFIGVSRPGLVRKRELAGLLDMARKPRSQWPTDATGAPGAPGTPGGSPGSTAADAGPAPPCTVIQVADLKAEAQRVGMSELEISGLLQRYDASRWEELSADQAEWLLTELRALPPGREPGEEG